MKYIVIHDSDLAIFQRKVNDALSIGFKLHKGMKLVEKYNGYGTHFFQAMKKKDEEW